MKQTGHVLVIGAAGLDVKAMPDVSLDNLCKDTDIQGRVRNSVGGVARNIAENLARLEMPTVLLSAVGDDTPGRRVLSETAASGVDVSEVRVVEDARTGTWMGLIDPDGGLRLAVADYGIMGHITPRYLYDRRKLFAEACIIVIDANLGTEAMRSLFKLAARYDLRVCADPTSASLAGRLCTYLDRLYMVTPNVREANALLCDVEIMVSGRDSALQAAQELVALGTEIGVVTLGKDGLVYATGDSNGYIPALLTEAVDTTGAGDALSAGAIFGILNDIPLDETMWLGVSAAAMTLRSPDTVVRDLSLEMLYDQLV